MFALLAMGGSAQAGPAVGRVIAMQSQGSMTREGSTLPLALSDEIWLKDEIITDATGKVQILFDDDTSISLGPNSRVLVEDFVDDGAKSSFSVNLMDGVARAITGRLVKQNPEGFLISAPAATVGIRGTILALQVVEGRTTVYVENSLDNKVFVNGIAVPQAFKLDVGEANPEPRPISQSDEIGLMRSTVPMLGDGLPPQPLTLEQVTRLRMAQGRMQTEPEQAYQEFSRLLRENPTNHEVNMGLADAAMAAGYLNQAVMVYERLLGQHPGEEWLLTRLGEVYSLLGDAGTSLRFFDRARRLRH